MRVSTLTLAISCVVAQALPAQVINFDDLAPSSAYGTAFPDPYKELRWALEYPPSLAYITAPSIGSSCHSGANCAFNGQGYATHLVRADGNLFALQDFWVRDWHAGPGVGAATSATRLNVRGLISGAVVFDRLFALSGSYRHEVISSMGVDKIEFVTHGGSNFTSGDGGYFLMDDLRVRSGVVPEPASMFLMATGLLGIAMARLRRR